MVEAGRSSALPERRTTSADLARVGPRTNPAAAGLAIRAGEGNAGVVSVSRSPVLVGRRAELATALSLVDAAARGRGSALLITGEAGVGKSRLVEEMRGRAATAGMAVCVGRSVEGGGTYRALTGALAPLIRCDPLLDGPGLRPYRAALRRLLPGDAPVEPLPPAPDPAVMLGEGVLALLAGRASLLVLEDLHWADPDTLDLVRYLADVLVELPVLLVLTARDDVAQPGVEQLTAELTTLPLRRLDAAGVAALAAACRGGEPLADRELHEVMERSDGLPFLVEELLAAGPAQVPASLTALVSRRLAALSARARPLVVAAAIAGGDPDWRLVAAMVDARDGGAADVEAAAMADARHSGPADATMASAHDSGAVDAAMVDARDGRPDAEGVALDALRAAAEVGLLVVDDQRLRWRHALTRDAVLATLLPPERAALAARAAAVLEERGDRAVAARLYIEAGDRARGAAILVELARVDVGRGALRSAAALLEQAGEDTAHADRVLVWTLLGRAVEALEAGERALAQVRGAEHAELCFRLAHAAIVAGRWGGARRFVERAARPADPRSLTLVADAAFGAGDVAEAERLSRAAVAATADPAMLCEALMVLSRSTFASDPAGSEAVGRRVAQIAAEHGLVPWRVQALFGLGSREHTRGDPDPPSLAAARELALEAGLLGYVVQADVLRANGILLVDGPAAALPLLRDTAERAGRLRLTGTQALAELFAAADAGLSVEERAMEAWLAAAVSRPDAPVEVITLGPLVRALPQLVRHDLARAAALLDRSVPAVLEHGSAIPVDHIGLWALVRTAVGDRDAAARATLRGNKALTALGNQAALAYADAIAAGRAGRPDAACALFVEADAMIAHLPWWNRLLRVVALEAAVADGWGDPVPALRTDLAAHEDAGAEHLARTCRDLLRAAGAPTRRRGGTSVAPDLRARGVTAREAEVLALVADGLTNAQMAERLYLSPRTVETHVARLLVKTGSADRSELRRWSSG